MPLWGLRDKQNSSHPHKNTGKPFCPSTLVVSKGIGQDFLRQWLSDRNYEYRILIFPNVDNIIRLPSQYTDCIETVYLDLKYDHFDT